MGIRHCSRPFKIHRTIPDTVPTSSRHRRKSKEHRNSLYHPCRKRPTNARCLPLQYGRVHRGPNEHTTTSSHQSPSAAIKIQHKITTTRPHTGHQTTTWPTSAQRHSLPTKSTSRNGDGISNNRHCQQSWQHHTTYTSSLPTVTTQKSHTTGTIYTFRNTLTIPTL